jgi:hypothetical protein
MAALVGLAGLLAAGSSPAATLKVHPDSVAVDPAVYFPTVHAANDAALAGDSVHVSSQFSPWLLDSTLVLEDDVVYVGGWGPEFEGPDPVTWETVLELNLPMGETGSVVDTGTSGSTTVFRGFTVTGGDTDTGGGIVVGSTSSAEIAECVVRENRAGTAGAGIAVLLGGSPLIRNCVIRDNAAGVRGGGISLPPNTDGTVIEFCTIERCSTIVDMTARPGGGGIFLRSSATIRNTTIRDCVTATRGGAIIAHDGATTPLLRSVQMFDNYATEAGGGLYAVEGSGTLDLCWLEGNTAGISGGGAYFLRGTWSVTGSVIRDCEALGGGLNAGGGGLYFFEATGAEVRNCEISRNTAMDGGGIRIIGPLFRSILSVEIDRNTIVCNTATGPDAGGGIHVGPAGNFADVVSNNIIAYQQQGSGISFFGLQNQPAIRYNCVFNYFAPPDTVCGPGNAAPAYGGDCDDRTNINGNIGGDPRFCNTVPDSINCFCDVDTDPDDIQGAFQLPLYLDPLVSPCLGAGEGGIDMGAYPAASGSQCQEVVRLEPMSWGKIKAAYR